MLAGVKNWKVESTSDGSHVLLSLSLQSNSFLSWFWCWWLLGLSVSTRRSPRLRQWLHPRRCGGHVWKHRQQLRSCHQTSSLWKPLLQCPTCLIYVNLGTVWQGISYITNSSIQLVLGFSPSSASEQYEDNLQLGGTIGMPMRQVRYWIQNTNRQWRGPRLQTRSPHNLGLSHCLNLGDLLLETESQRSHQDQNQERNELDCRLMLSNTWLPSLELCRTSSWLSFSIFHSTQHFLFYLIFQQHMFYTPAVLSFFSVVQCFSWRRLTSRNVLYWCWFFILCQLIEITI